MAGNKKDRDIEDLLNKDGRMMRSPLLWFGLLLIPVVLSFVSALLGPSEGVREVQLIVYNPPGAEAPLAVSPRLKAGVKGGRGAPPLVCEFEGWVGRIADEKLQAELKAMGRPFRIIPPGAVVTQDYSEERANFETGADGKIIRAWCG